MYNKIMQNYTFTNNYLPFLL